jgi:broad specificity phosphatase PhoE
MPQLYLIRHAEPENAGKLLGRSDPPLSAEGRAQALALRIECTRIYTSTLKRARETAALLSRGRPIFEWPELAEMSLGVWDGLSWSEIEHQWPDLAASKLQDWFGVTPPGGEPWEQVCARVERVYELIRRGPMPAAVVSHVGVNAALAFVAAGHDPMKFHQDYCGVITLEF